MTHATPLAELATAHGLTYRPGKPHKLALPLSKALSVDGAQVQISNPTESALDITVHVRGRWGTSGWKVSPTDVPAIIEEARANVARIENILEEAA